MIYTCCNTLLMPSQWLSLLHLLTCCHSTKLSKWYSRQDNSNVVKHILTRATDSHWGRCKLSVSVCSWWMIIRCGKTVCHSSTLVPVGLTVTLISLWSHLKDWFQRVFEYILPCLAKHCIKLNFYIKVINSVVKL